MHPVILEMMVTAEQDNMRQQLENQRNERWTDSAPHGWWKPLAIGLVSIGIILIAVGYLITA